VPRLADAGDDDASAPLQDELDRALECRAEAVGERGDGGGFDSEHAAGKRERGAVGG